LLQKPKSSHCLFPEIDTRKGVGSARAETI